VSARASRSTELAADLTALGVRQGDCLMVHASLRAIGAVEGRAAGVVDALDRAVGGAGTLMMVLGARDDSSWVNERDESEREVLLAEAEPFDAWTSATSPRRFVRTRARS
jgi:aminoglycoside N3'-acetyltransferase